MVVACGDEEAAWNACISQTEPQRCGSAPPLLQSAKHLVCLWVGGCLGGRMDGWVGGWRAEDGGWDAARAARSLVSPRANRSEQTASHSLCQAEETLRDGDLRGCAVLFSERLGCTKKTLVSLSLSC